jgi:hypothetical protein
MQLTPERRLGVVNAIRLMIQNVGLMVGTAVTLTIAAGHLPPEQRSQVFGGSLDGAATASVDGTVAGHREAIFVMCGLSVLGVIACLVSRRLEHQASSASAASERDTTTPPTIDSQQRQGVSSTRITF